MGTGEKPAHPGDTGARPLARRWAGAARNAVFGGCGMGDVRRRVTGHVAVDAAILWTGLEPLFAPQAASMRLVAGEAAFAEMRYTVCLRRFDVRIVARDTTHLAGTLLKALALIHLFNMIDRVVIVAVVDDHGPERLERHSWPVVEHPAATARQPFFPLQMALLADRFPQCRGKVPWVDDGFVGLAVRFVPELPLHVKRAGPVASLTADRGLSAEDWLDVLVERSFDMLDSVRVAKEALLSNQPAGPDVRPAG